jgi:RNA polymerase sigma-70 factor, ECF subfamily
LPNGLIAAAVRGDRRARDELLALIQPLVLGYCRARLGRQESVLGSADDVAQEVCLAVVSALGSYQPAGLSFRAFVYGIAVPSARRRGIGRVTPRPFTISRRWMSALPLISTTPTFFAKVR